MADKEKLDWWEKPDHLKKNAQKQRTQKTRTAAPKSPRKPKQEKPRLSKMALFLRSLKHCAYMVAIIVVGAILAHLLLTGLTRHGARRTVPDLESMTMEEAQVVAKRSDLKLIINDSLYATNFKPNTVLDQLPKGGTVVKPGRAIYLTVNATQRRIVDVPYVAERSLRQAINLLLLSGFSIGELKYEDDMAKNYILSQYIGNKEIKADSKERAQIGTKVTLHVGRGGAYSTLVPMLMGLTLRDAKSALWDAGLNLGQVKKENDEENKSETQLRVYSQSSTPESARQLAGKVSLSVTSEQSKVDSLLKIYYKEQEMLRKAREAQEKSELYDGL